MLIFGARVPPNVKFEVDDVEGDWVYAHPFDYIFCRYMTGSIADWPKLVKNIYECVSSRSIIRVWARHDVDFNLVAT
jgi:hypothetical protein